jgi:hypothetical protein
LGIDGPSGDRARRVAELHHSQGPIGSLSGGHGRDARRAGRGPTGRAGSRQRREIRGPALPANASSRHVVMAFLRPHRACGHVTGACGGPLCRSVAPIGSWQPSETPRWRSPEAITQRDDKLIPSLRSTAAQNMCFPSGPVDRLPFCVPVRTCAPSFWRVVAPPSDVLGRSRWPPVDVRAALGVQPEVPLGPCCEGSGRAARRSCGNGERRTPSDEAGRGLPDRDVGGAVAAERRSVPAVPALSERHARQLGHEIQL